jgi:hypothetical protein
MQQIGQKKLLLLLLHYFPYEQNKTNSKHLYLKY